VAEEKLWPIVPNLSGIKIFLDRYKLTDSYYC